MDIFISWSGERSKAVAEALRYWLPKIINAIDPWLSSADIDKGARWSSDVASKLEAAKVGIICLTPGNVHSDWILFEAGALSKTIQNTFVCPLLIDLNPSDIRGPLAQFQTTRGTKDEIRKLLSTINSAVGERALSDSHLDEAFEVWWPKLDERLQSLPNETGATKSHRPERDILEEILALVRSQARTEVHSISPADDDLKTLRVRFVTAAHKSGVALKSYRMYRVGDHHAAEFTTNDGRTGSVIFPATHQTMAKLVNMIRGALLFESEDQPSPATAPD